MSKVILPFNHQPTSSETGDESDPYTCPAGKYARVVCTLQATAWGTVGGMVSTQSAVLEVWLRQGQVLDGTVSVALGTTIGTSVTSVTIGGNVISSISATATDSTGVTGSCAFHYYAEEYLQLT